MDITLKEFIITANKIWKKEILDSKNELLEANKIEDEIEREEKIKDIKDSINFNESLLLRGDEILKEL